MDYDALLTELYGRERCGSKLGLETITDLLGHMGNPHRRFKTLHVTGTNGKGSVCAFVASVLRKAGYRVGLYTSPHLVRFNERIQVDGREISNADVARIYAEMGPAIAKTSGGSKVKQPTFFEVTTAMAFHYFAERAIDIGVIEVGMGGKMDATNVVHPLVAVLTRIGLEHTEHLGKTEERIAREKAGIIKPGCRVVTVDQPTVPLITAQAHALRCPITIVGRDVVYERLAFDLSGQTLTISDDLRVLLTAGHGTESRISRTHTPSRTPDDSNASHDHVVPACWSSSYVRGPRQRLARLSENLVGGRPSGLVGGIDLVRRHHGFR